MQKIKHIYHAEVFQDDKGDWRVWRNGAVSGKYPTKERAEENLQIHFKAAQDSFGDKYEVVLEKPTP